MRQGLRFGVGCRIRQGVDGCTANSGAPDDVGMQRQEQVCPVLPGDADTLLEAQKTVAGSGQDDVVAFAIEPLLELLGKCEDDRFFRRTVLAGGPRVDAAMAGVDDDGEAARRRSAGLDPRLGTEGWQFLGNLLPIERQGKSRTRLRLL